MYDEIVGLTIAAGALSCLLVPCLCKAAVKLRTRLPRGGGES